MAGKCINQHADYEGPGNDINILVQKKEQTDPIQAVHLKAGLSELLSSLGTLDKKNLKISLELDPSTYVLKAKLKDGSDTVISTSEGVDFPIETLVANAKYDESEKKLVLTLKNGTTIDVSVADLISGLVNESDIVDNLTSTDTDKPLSANQGKVLKDAIDAKYTKPKTGIPLEDFSEEAKEKLSVNDTLDAKIEYLLMMVSAYGPTLTNPTLEMESKLDYAIMMANSVVIAEEK